MGPEQWALDEARAIMEELPNLNSVTDPYTLAYAIMNARKKDGE